MTTHTLAHLREMHDSDLRELGTAEAKQVLANRRMGATFIRSILARVYARPDMATSRQWHVIPCVTDNGTLGIVDVAAGTAWDTAQAVPPEVDDLGYDDRADQRANNPTAGMHIYEDKKTNAMIASHHPVRHDGLADITPPIPRLPDGWSSIALPTWRGYDGDGHRLAPIETYTDQAQWIEPRLVAFGLATCYGGRGRPRHTLADTHGWHVAKGDSPAAWQNVPPWITPGSEAPDPAWWPWTKDGLTRAGDLIFALHRAFAASLAAHFDDPAATMAAYDAAMTPPLPCSPALPEEMETHGRVYFPARDAVMRAIRDSRMFVPARALEQANDRRAYEAETSIRIIERIFVQAVMRRLASAMPAVKWMTRYNQESTAKALAIAIAAAIAADFGDQASVLLRRSLVAALYGCAEEEIDK